jgi:hypothetical protein
VQVAPGFRVVVSTHGFIEAPLQAGRPGPRGGHRAAAQGEFALLYERLNARRPEPLRDDTTSSPCPLPTSPPLGSCHRQPTQRQALVGKLAQDEAEWRQASRCARSLLAIPPARMLPA